MAKTLEILSAGLSPQAASAIQGGTFNGGGLTATGTTKATSLLLPASDNLISLCSSGKGVSLPPTVIQGDDINVYNSGLNACLIYTPIGTSQVITNGSANQGFSVAANRSAAFTLVTATQWMVNYSA